MPRKIRNKPPVRQEKLLAVTGYRGRLGSALVSMGYLPIDVDITNPKQVSEIVGDINPDVLVNCAGITDVDGCELDLFRKAIQVNGIGLAILRDNFDGRLIHISTDFIFDGKSGPYSENSPPNPLGQYGDSKLLGEELIREYDYDGDTIIRTTVLYGGNKADFVRKVLNKLERGKVVTLPMNMYGTPTYIPHLALGIHHVSKMKSPPQIVNIVGRDCISRYEFGLMIANIFGYDAKLIYPTRKMEGQARRPKRGGLKIKLAEKLGIPIYSVLDGLHDFHRRMNGQS